MEAISITDLPSWWKSDKPYIIGDSLAGMKALPDKCITLILTDPPYGIGESLKDHKGRGRYDFGGKSANQAAPNKRWATSKDYGHYAWDKERISKEFFDEMFRVSKNQIIFGGNYYTDYLYPTPCWIVWDKDNGDNDFADCELAWCSFKSAVRKFKYRWMGLLQEDMKNKEERFHPTQKPVALFEWLLEKYSQPGDIIFDPFLGSGTALIAARKTGRLGLGFELNPDYEAAIRKRSLLDIKPLEGYF